MSGAKIERVAQKHTPVVDLNRLNLDGASRTRPILFLGLTLEQRAQVPAPIFLLAGDDANARSQGRRLGPKRPLPRNGLAGLQTEFDRALYSWPVAGI